MTRLPHRERLGTASKRPHRARGLVIGDLHLTTRPADEYRWAFLDWLGLMVDKYSVAFVVFLGDLTEAKDGHPARLVNRLVKHLTDLVFPTEAIFVVKGNHDYADPKEPFFGFLDEVRGVYYVASPVYISLSSAGRGGPLGLFLPHTRDWRRDWANYDVQEKELTAVFLHQTLTGAVGDNGRRLQGAPTTIFARCKADVFSGDVHVPQRTGKVTYVGAPYPIHFGDDYKPRVLLYDTDDRSVSELHPPSIRKLNVVLDSAEDLDDLRLRRGDQVKFTLRLKRSEFADWPERRQAVLDCVKEKGASVFGVKLEEKAGRVRLSTRQRLQTNRPEDVLRTYCKHAALEDEALVAYGLGLVEDDG